MPSLRSFFSHSRLLLGCWALALFAFTLALDLRHHRFPYYYHPDEPGKVEQVLGRHWNFHHPMLLLSTTSVAVKLGPTPTEQAVVETGRTVSAVFIALAVVALSLTAYCWQGWNAAIIAGVALATHHQLYELAHYMKEDSALLVGLSFSFLASLLYVQTPSPARALFLGASCGLAISGKYLGIVCLAVAGPALWYAPPALRRRDLWLSLAALVVTFTAINLPLLLDLTTLHQSLNHEMSAVVHGQGDVTRRVPHPLYWNVFLINSTPVIWLLLIAFFTRPRGLPGGEQVIKRILAFFPLAFTIMLSFSPKENDRYFLPATALFTLLASLGVAFMPDLIAQLLSIFGVHRPERFFTRTVRHALVWSSATLLWTLQITGWTSTKPGLWRYDHAFLQDDIADLAAWMRKDLPPDAVVAADSRTGLQERGRRKQPGRMTDVPQKLIVTKLAADGGSLDDLRAQGVGYIVVSETSYGRFFRDDLRAKDQDDAHYLKAKAFYDRLLREGDLLFERDRGTVIYLHPGIRVYKL